MESNCIEEVIVEDTETDEETSNLDSVRARGNSLMSPTISKLRLLKRRSFSTSSHPSSAIGRPTIYKTSPLSTRFTINSILEEDLEDQLTAREDPSFKSNESTALFATSNASSYPPPLEPLEYLGRSSNRRGSFSASHLETLKKEKELESSQFNSTSFSLTTNASIMRINSSENPQSRSLANNTLLIKVCTFSMHRSIK
jgi:hypothetical protein